MHYAPIQWKGWNPCLECSSRNVQLLFLTDWGRTNVWVVGWVSLYISDACPRPSGVVRVMTEATWETHGRDARTLRALSGWWSVVFPPKLQLQLPTFTIQCESAKSVRGNGECSWERLKSAGGSAVFKARNAWLLQRVPLLVCRSGGNCGHWWAERKFWAASWWGYFCSVNFPRRPARLKCAPASGISQVSSAHWHSDTETTATWRLSQKSHYKQYSVSLNVILISLYG